MTGFLFYVFGGLALICAAAVVLTPKPTRALLSLVVGMFGLAVVYLLLGAYFVAMVHIIVYAGAVLVLFLFVIMLQGTGAKEVPVFGRFNKGHILLSGIAAAAFLGILIYLLNNVGLTQGAGFAGQSENFGLELFRNYVLPFELTSLLILVGVFAAVGLAKKEDA